MKANGSGSPQPLLSVIVPVYNGMAYLPPLIGSLADLQAHTPCELVLVDDGSTDASPAYLDENEGKWSHDFSSVRIVHQENGGIVSARNTGLRYATGDYLLFADQDDLVRAEGVLEALTLARQDDLPLVFFGTEHLTGELTSPCDQISHPFSYGREAVERHLLEPMLYNQPGKDLSYIGHTWQAVYQREFVLGHSISFKAFMDIEDDYLFVFDCLAHAGRCAGTPNVGYLWRDNQDSKSHTVAWIDGLYDGYDAFYAYLRDTVARTCRHIELGERFETYSTQFKVVDCLFFTCMSGHTDPKDLAALKALVKSSHDAFKGSALYPFAGMRAITYKLLHAGLGYRAVSLAYAFYRLVKPAYRRVKRS